MLLLPPIHLPRTLNFLVGKVSNTFAVKVLKITKKITINEASYYLRQAIDLCYRSNGAKMPDEFRNWVKNNIKIDYLDLPPDVQSGITGILFHSAKIKSIIQKFIINLPT